MGKRETIIRLLLIVTLSTFVVSRSIYLPPLDGIVFNAVANSWINGQIPYLDYFDHKGPVIYLINMVGVYGGDLGLFLVEVIFLTISFEFIYRCGVILKTRRVLNYTAVIITFVLMVVFYSGGNLTEEWSLPFEVIPLYLTLRLLMSNDTNNSYINVSFISGISFGIVTMMRVNNNAIICGLALSLLIILIHRRQYRLLFKCIVLFIGGTLLVIIPFLIYFYCVGAFDWMIYSNLTFNLLYKQAWTLQPNYTGNIIRLLPCIVLSIIALYTRNRFGNAYTIIMLCISVISFGVFIDSYYSHYFIMVLPLVALCIQSSTQLTKYVQIAVCILMLCTIKLSGVREMEWVARNVLIRIHESMTHKYEGTAFILNHIPQEERDSIYVCNKMNALGSVVESGHLPVGKYTFLQTDLATVDEKIDQDVKNEFKKVNPKWILSEGNIDSSTIEACGIRQEQYKILTHDSISDIPTQWQVLKRIL